MIDKYDELIKIMKEVKEIIDSPNTDVAWSRYNNVEEVINDLDSCIGQLKEKDKSVIEKLKILFAPTGTFQEISIDSGWSDKYLELAIIYKVIGGFAMFIKQDDLTIRNATMYDVPILGKWWRDGAIMAHAGFPKGLQVTNNEIATQLSADTDETCRRLIIEYCNIPIGEMAYYNKGNGVAEIGIKICNFEKQEKGYGTKLLKILISTLFYEYGYSKIILDTNLNNIRAQHVYEKLGFRKVRVNMNSWKNQFGELESSVDYEITKDDFENCIKFAKSSID